MKNNFKIGPAIKKSLVTGDHPWFKIFNIETECLSGLNLNNENSIPWQKGLHW